MATVGLWVSQGVAFALLLSTAFSLGQIAVRWLGLSLPSRWEAAAVSVAAGLALGGQLSWLLAAAGFLRIEAVLALAAAAHLVAARGWRAGFRAPSRSSIRLALGAAILLLPCFALTLFPPHAFDELTYHLPFARGLAATGHLNFHEDLRLPVFPQLAEALFAALLLTAGETATHVVQFAAALATGGLLLVWVRRRPTRAGLLAGAAFFGGPIVVFYAATGFVDLVLTLLVALSVWALDRWSDGEDGEWRWAALAGFAAGSAAAVKYLGLFFVFLGVVWLLASRTRRGRRTAGLSCFALAATTAAAPTYLWIFWVTGNPLFPFLTRWFGSSAWAPVSDLGFAGALWRSWLWPLEAVFSRVRWNWQPPYHPVFLLALPVALWGAGRERRVRRLAMSAAAWTLTLPLLPADSRYGLPALPLWLAAAAATLARCQPMSAPLGGTPARRHWLPVLAALVLASGPAYALSKLFLWGPPPVDRVGTERFLSRRLPEFELLRPLLEEPANKTVYLYGGENLRGLFRGEVLGDWSGPYRFSWIPALAGSPKEGSLCRLLESWGVERFVWFSRMSQPPASFASLGACFEEWRRDRYGVVLRVVNRPPASGLHGARAPGE
jgi:hypothetical protein